MFPGCQNVAIRGGNFNVNMNGSQPSAFQKLLNISAPSALYNSEARFDPPKCHPKTRVAILEYLVGWIFGRNDPEALIMWLYGPAGAGKSAILQTIAEWCAKNNKLLASFFFGRSDPTRNHIKPLIPTIACQITITIPELKPYVEGAIERDPFLLDKSLATQFQLLIVAPLQALVVSGDLKPGSPHLIIIDGLDECKDPKTQSTILRVIADALRSQNVPLRFLIASRPEHNIHHTFSSTPLSGLWRSAVLDYTYAPDDDIRLFLTDSFHEIKTTHRYRHLIPEMWPRQYNIDTLIQKSSGQFIYASQVVKYISHPSYSPSRRLDVIMGLRSAHHDLPFAELDALYMHILQGCSEDLDVVLSILGLRIIGVLYSHVIEGLLSLEHGDIDIKLAPLASVVYVDTDPSGLRPVTLWHASFEEFLTDPSRASPNLYINRLTVRERGLSLLLSCLRLGLPSIWTSSERILGWLFRDSFEALYNGLPLTKKIEDMLMDVSLLDFWTSNSSLSNSKKCGIIDAFLDILQGTGCYNQIRPASEREIVEKIYKFHKSSLEPTLRLEFSKYLKNNELMIAVNLTELYQRTSFRLNLSGLLQFPPETRLVDEQSLGLGSSPEGGELIYHHYKELVPLIDPSDYVPAALRIVALLCAKSPHPMRYYEPSQLSKSAPTIHIQSAIPRPTWMLWGKPFILTSYATYQTRRRSVPYSRLRRQEKHCHGVRLTLASPGRWQERRPTGFFFLLDILEECSKSEELIAFIRTHGNKMAFFPNITRRAIRIMHAYLDRVTKDVEMIDSEYPAS